MTPIDLFSKRSKSNTFENLKLDDLRNEDVRLDIELKKLYKEINAISEQKKAVFNEGIGADILKKKMLVLKLKGLETNGNLKLKEYVRRISEKTFVSNLIIIKKYQESLKTSPIWKKLVDLSPEELEKALAGMTIEGENVDSIVTNLNDMLAFATESDSIGLDIENDPAFEAWDSIEKGNLSPEAAGEQLYSIDKGYEKVLKNT